MSSVYRSTPTMHHRTRRNRSKILLISLLVWWIPCLAAAEGAFSVSGGGELVVWDPEQGDLRVVGLTGVEDTFFSLAFDVQGSLFGVAAPFNQPASLYRVDTSNGSAEAVGPLGLSLPGGLTIDDQGRLWLTAESDLYQVDPDTGAATMMASYGDQLTGLAADGDRLLAFTTGGGALQQVLAIDLETLAAELLYELDLDRYGVSNASFDRLGNLWLMTSRSDGNLANYDFAFWRLDVTTGMATRTYDTVLFFGSPLSGFRGLAVQRGGAEPLVVPTSSQVGLTVLSVLLAAAALLGLRNQG